ncbi:MAG TPA: ribose-phosphate pyrophosphokinase [Bacteroidales bacterium]|nr:ribose-phosphate pyrophosphokinase [Bacteroidales bacterium]HNY75709.1 ribose-phosphate pyrophosphokinase [Bacteroidales bacterium]HOH93690.1 ribose-phosphate pyrophosphokinase [Bacteroidales bacterium]
MVEPKVGIYSGNASRVLAESIAKNYGIPLGKTTYTKFADGEFQVSFDETIRGKEVFIVQSTFPPVDNLFELLLMIDAAKRASAKHIYAVIPYFGFARQDRKDKPRVAIGSKLVADLLQAAGTTHVITMDLHADQLQGFFNIPVDHLFASSIFYDYIRDLNIPKLVVSSPDTGGTKRANVYAKAFSCDMAICYKQREKANQISDMVLIGDVKNKNVIIFDDIVDTAGSLIKAANLMKEKGALTIRAVCTHALLSNNAIEKIDESVIDQLIVTDTIPLRKTSDKIVVLSVAKIFSEVIKRNIQCESISSFFDFNPFI